MRSRVRKKQLSGRIRASLAPLNKQNRSLSRRIKMRKKNVKYEVPKLSAPAPHPLIGKTGYDKMSGRTISK